MHKAAVCRRLLWVSEALALRMIASQGYVKVGIGYRWATLFLLFSQRLPGLKNSGLEPKCIQVLKVNLVLVDWLENLSG